ncbi:hypothetical protein DBV15_08932 [Temnothorax longispinosus]|uniref:Uncharacterized protein n=1 Tax=Temnothorax longispinosus TaxID=300112 RepID=A0A4S2JB12_9HYME|nr:hypothetical protein DBV15_08932 [Temnothorax longispinosus]
MAQARKYDAPNDSGYLYEYGRANKDRNAAGCPCETGVQGSSFDSPDSEEDSLICGVRIMALELRRGEKAVAETETSERVSEREREKRKRKKKRERKVEGSPDETNSKRDVLLIILTPGVRLNERRSQTREARCKFNYREEESAERKARKGARDRKKAVVIKGTRDSQWHTERPSRMRLSKLSRTTENVFLGVSDSSVISSFLVKTKRIQRIQPPKEPLSSPSPLLPSSSAHICYSTRRLEQAQEKREATAAYAPIKLTLCKYLDV